MKFGVVNKSTTVNRFVLHTLQRNITHLAVITRKTNKKLGILKGGELKKSRKNGLENTKKKCGFRKFCFRILAFPLLAINTVSVVRFL